MSLVVKRPQVVQDLAHLSSYIARQSPATVRRFLRAADQTFVDLADMPGAGSPCDVIRPDLADLRFRHVCGFKNHLVIYRPLIDGVQIIRVYHASQDLATLLGDEI